MKSNTLNISIDESRFRYGIKNLTVDLFVYPATISDGTILGVRAVKTTGQQAVAVQGSVAGNYFFTNIPIGKYTVVLSGAGVTTQIPERLNEIDTGLPWNTTGSDIPWNDNTEDSIATKLNNLETRLSLIEPQ
jgi:hypothetical protein